MSRHLLLALSLILGLWLPLATSASVPRVTSIEISQHFINDQLKAHMKPGSLVRDLSVDLDPKTNRLFLRGIVDVPVEDLKAVNLDKNLNSFRFQMTILPLITPKKGYLLLVFPLAETYFYPATSKHPERDRVVVPVQLLSLALASARGYLGALSGDYSSYDRRTTKLQALIRALNRSMASEKNPDALDYMKTEREALKLQLAAIPLERKQMGYLSKDVSSLLHFGGEKEVNLNESLVAHRNALIIKLNLASLAPYLTGVKLSGVRILHDKRDGMDGENYFAIDINADLTVKNEATLDAAPADEQGLKIAPDATIRISQALFRSELMASAQKKALGSQLEDLKIEMKEDGLHVEGKYRKFFFRVPFDTVVDLDIAEADDTFDVSVRSAKIAGLNLQFLTGYILSFMESRLDKSLAGICDFEYVGQGKDQAEVLRVHLNPAKLIPALPGLHLVDIEVRDREFLLKVGRF